VPTLATPAIANIGRRTAGLAREDFHGRSTSRHPVASLENSRPVWSALRGLSNGLHMALTLYARRGTNALRSASTLLRSIPYGPSHCTERAPRSKGRTRRSRDARSTLKRTPEVRRGDTSVRLSWSTDKADCPPLGRHRRECRLGRHRGDRPHGALALGTSQARPRGFRIRQVTGLEGPLTSRWSR
jgi:hypothetical protein